MSHKFHARHFAALAALAFACLPLAGCETDEPTQQREAVEYTLQQRYGAQCAQLGLIPGSAPFNDCVAKLEGAPLHGS